MQCHVCVKSSHNDHALQGDALSVAHSFYVPPLKVRKDWFEGLNPDPIDHKHPDVGNLADAQANYNDDEVRIMLHQLYFCMHTLQRLGSFIVFLQI